MKMKNACAKKKYESTKTNNWKKSKTEAGLNLKLKLKYV